MIFEKVTTKKNYFVKFMCYFAQILVHHISGNNEYILLLLMLAYCT